MQKIIGEGLDLMGKIFGDAMLSKWLGAVQFWLRRKASDEIRRRAQEEYELLCLDWDRLKSLRPPHPPDEEKK